jgi:3-oxoadipate enol-lactonase
MQGAVALNHALEGPEEAPVLVLSNSLGTTLGMWDDQAPALRERFRLLRYDGRGHGGSPAPPGPYTIGDLGSDVLSLLDGLGIEHASFCGLSIGGMVGMWLASEAPERFERLVLCCTAARLLAPEAWQTRAQTVRAEGYAGCCEAIRDMDLRGRLGSISAPTLVIAGAEDPATPPEHGELIRDSIPDASLELIPNAAHLANVEQPEAVTEAILDHLAPVSEPRRER